MELVQEVMKDMLNGRTVRIGFKGQMPIFSVNQALNLTQGLGKSNAFGRNFLHNVLKDKHPELHAQVIYHRFPQCAHEAPCMTFRNMLTTLGLARTAFSMRLSEIASAGILRAEAGDLGLVEYVLHNAVANSEYHTLVRQILWAERNPESALNNVGPAGDGVGGAQTSSGSLLQQQPHAPNPEVHTHTTPRIFLLSARFIDAQYVAGFHRPSPCG